MTILLHDRTEATVRLFMKNHSTVGAFTFSDNFASQSVLKKNGFQLLEEFVEDGKASKYYQLSL